MQDFIPRKIDINQKMAAVVVKQFDNLSRLLHVQMMDRDLSEDDEGAPMNLVGCEARLYVETSGEASEYIDGEIADGENGIVTFTLPNSVTQEVGTYPAEIWITNAEEEAVISSKPFLLKVEQSIRNDDAIEATETFSALENALLRVAVDRARLNHLEALASSDNVVPGTAESEVVGIRIGYDGTVYATAGNAVREQITALRSEVSAVSQAVSAIVGGYAPDDEVGQLVTELQAVLEHANTFQWQIDDVSRSLQRVTEFIPNGGITQGKICDEAVSAEKLSAAVRRPCVTISAGTVAEMLWCAESYFNRAYTPDGQDSGFLYETGAGLYSDSLGENAAEGQFGIVCSSFAEAVLNGISFENSRYANDANAAFSWGVRFDETVPFGRSENPTSVEIDNRYLTSQALAKYAMKHGYLYAIDGSETVRAGDLLFSGNVEGRYLGIDHVAVVVNTDGTYCTVVESWPAQKTDVDGTQHDVGLQIRYRVPITNYTYGAVFPVGDIDNNPKVLETVYDKNGNTNSATVIHTFRQKVTQGFYTVVCHGACGGAPYVSLKYDGADSNTMQSVMHGVGDAHYLTVYVQKPAVLSLRMTSGNVYDLEEVTLYRGYAEITAHNGCAARLSAGDDLDDCLDGVWYCRNTETASAILHAPLREPTGGFRLEALRMTGGERYMQQVWYVGSPENMYVRMFTANGWTGWFVYSGTAV